MKHKITTLLVAVVALLLIACNSRLGTEVFLRDLEDAPEETLTNNLNLYLPLPSMDSCEEYKGRYAKVWRKSRDFRDMKFIKCHESGMDNYVHYEFDVPMRAIEDEDESMLGPIEIIRMDDPETNDRLLFMRVKPSSLYNLDKLFEDEFYQNLDLSDSSPLISVSNDLRADQEVVVSHSFVQNAPVIDPKTFTLEPRDSLDIVLSDVKATWLFTVSNTLPPRMLYIATWLQEEEE